MQEGSGTTIRQAYKLTKKEDLAKGEEAKLRYLNALAAAAHLCVNGVPCDAFRRLEVWIYRTTM